jgi:hypothetical protein
MPDMKKIFSYEEAAALIPEVQQLTVQAVAEVETLLSVVTGTDVAPEVSAQYQRIVSTWAEAIMDLGIEVKGLWLIDFDNGSGYYCWKYPEAALQYFHGYEEGFSGRVQLN